MRFAADLDPAPPEPGHAGARQASDGRRPACAEGEDVQALLAGDQRVRRASGDCIVDVAGGAAHTLIAGEQGLDVLAFGTRRAAPIARLPRAGVAWLGRSWVEIGGEPHPWGRETAAGELLCPEPGARPANVVAVAEVKERVIARGDTDRRQRDLAKAAGSRITGLNHVVVASGKLSCPPHVHSAEEEIFVILEGEGTLLLYDWATLPGPTRCSAGGAPGCVAQSYSNRVPSPSRITKISSSAEWTCGGHESLPDATTTWLSPVMREPAALARSRCLRSVSPRAMTRSFTAATATTLAGRAPGSGHRSSPAAVSRPHGCGSPPISTQLLPSQATPARGRRAMGAARRVPKARTSRPCSPAINVCAAPPATSTMQSPAVTLQVSPSCQLSPSPPRT